MPVRHRDQTATDAVGRQHHPEVEAVACRDAANPDGKQTEKGSEHQPLPGRFAVEPRQAALLDGRGVTVQCRRKQRQQQQGSRQELVPARTDQACETEAQQGSEFTAAAQLRKTEVGGLQQLTLQR